MNIKSCTNKFKTMLDVFFVVVFWRYQSEPVNKLLCFRSRSTSYLSVILQYESFGSTVFQCYHTRLEELEGLCDNQPLNRCLCVICFSLFSSYSQSMFVHLFMSNFKLFFTNKLLLLVEDHWKLTGFTRILIFLTMITS